MLSFIAFFVTICYHTIYSSPWIFTPLALYGLDLLIRMFRHRIKDAVLAPIGNQMTLVSREFVLLMTRLTSIRSIYPTLRRAGSQASMFDYACSFRAGCLSRTP